METNKICMVSKLISRENPEIRHFLRIDMDNEAYSGWTFLSGNEDMGFIENPENFTHDILSKVIFSYPALRPYIDEPVGSAFQLDSRTNAYTPVEKSRRFTVGNDSVASNPGRVVVEPLHWLKHYPKEPFKWHTGAILFIVLALWGSWIFMIPAILCMARSVFYWLRTFEHFKVGDTNPGIVVAINPTLVAVATDLTKGFGHYPVVRITKVPLKSISGAKIAVGDRLPTVALYGNQENDAPHWSDFYPVPVNCATSDRNVIEHLTRSFTNEEWAELERRLEQVPEPYQPGLYRIVEDSDWS